MTSPKKGYEITFNQENRILKFRGWGLWDSDIIRKFEEEWNSKVKEVNSG